MRLQNEDEEEYSSFSVKMPTIILAASAAIFVVLAIVLAVNSANKKKTVYRPAATAADASSDIQTTEERDTLTANDLNFWDMYQDETGATILERETDDNLNRKDELEEREARMREEEEAAAELAAKEAEANLDPATDGKHTMVTHIDGSTEWIAINSSIRQNTYEDTQFQSQNGIIGYYVNGRRTSKTGADISQYTTAIDWDRLSTEVDYVMIRVGARGYDTGKIIADTKFIDNVTNAYKKGIPFGVYFSSQAISETEAKEEAAFVMTQLVAAQSAIENAAQTTTGTDAAQTTGSAASGTGATDTANTSADSTTTTSNQVSVAGSNGASAATGDTAKALNDLGIVTDKTKYNTTTQVKDADGNTTTTVIDNLGNIAVSVTDAGGTVLSSKTVTLDPYGNVTTVNTDANGNQTVDTRQIAGAAISTDSAGQTVSSAPAYSAPAGSAFNSADVNNRFRLTYPVAIEMHMITNDISRIESINKTQRTSVLTAFCNAIETGGYNSVINASKEFLLCQVNTAGLSKYGIWLNNEGSLPDYPYIMNMWKYNTKGKLLQSLSGDYGVSVGFIDYSVR